MNQSPRERAEPRIDDEAPAYDNDRRGPGRSPSEGGRGNGVLILIILLLVALGAGVWWYLTRQQPLPPLPSSSPAATAPPTPAVEQPVATAPSTPPTDVSNEPLPSLAASDPVVRSKLADLFGAARVGRLFYDDGIIHRFVATVDALPRPMLPARYPLLKPAPGTMRTVASGDHLAIAPDNAARYALYMAALSAVDPALLVAAYAHFYPLLEQDYRDLGYPTGNFNDRLLQVIDNLLAAPDVPPPVGLVQPKVEYTYADADLESRSAGQKIMIRLGSQNEAKVKARLRDIRARLVGANAPPTPH